MKASPLAVAGVVLASTAQAQVVQFDIERRHAPSLRKRDATIDSTLFNEKVQGGYFINVEVGTPGQNITLQLDTGSSDVWVPASTAPICTQTSDRNPGCTFGSCKLKKKLSLSYVFAAHLIPPFSSQFR